MTEDEQQPGGLLSKVVKFVRHPTMNWADLDQPEDKESHYSKQMLKEMIERKRANDFVRRREFDQLRKLRQRGALGGATDLDAIGQGSMFQSSMPSDPGDRAGTLKKIDEIEAQMSQQWWKARDEHRAPSDPLHDERGAGVPQSPADAHQFATTVLASHNMGMTPDLSDFAATDISPREGLHAEDAPPVDMLASLDFGGPRAQPSPAPQPDLAENFAHDPALEEASIRFANGDDAGAEAALLALLTADAQGQVHEGLWMGLFDLYRATNQHDKFEAAALEFAVRFHRSAPIWFSIPDMTHGLSGAPQVQDAAKMFHWSSPSVLGPAPVLALQSMLAERKPESLKLNWTQLVTIPDAALEPLLALFTKWTQQKIRLQCVAGVRLEDLLRSRTVSGERQVAPTWWRLRMEWLRITQRPHEFDLVALDYCITYEVSPPSWQEAVSSFLALDGAPATGPDAAAVPGGAGEPSLDFADSQATASGGGAAQAVAVGALSGVVLGDASEALAPFEAKVQPQGLLVVSCERLVRIDFAAAGSVLNWAATQQSAGRRVQFRGLHRLAAVFFNVIGVGEHARIFSRRN